MCVSVCLFILQRMCSEGQAKMFGKCCQLHPTGGSSSSLDSSSSSSCASENRDSKEPGLRFQVTHALHTPLI